MSGKSERTPLVKSGAASGAASASYSVEMKKGGKSPKVTTCASESHSRPLTLKQNADHPHMLEEMPHAHEEFDHHWIDDYLPHFNGHSIRYKFLNNVAAGVTVSLINIPLSISLAVAADSTPVCGVITALWAGLIAAATGGSHYNIMGPTGALSGILARYAMLWGTSSLPILSITSGLIMFLCFLFKWDKYVTFLPSGVAHGFTLGVAILIAGGQISSMFELPPLPPHSNFFANMYEILSHMSSANFNSFLVFAFSWVSLFSLVKWRPKIPWSVLIAAVGIFIGFLSEWGYIFPLRKLRDKYGELTASLWQPPNPSSDVAEEVWADPKDLIIASCSIAFVSVLESLISGKIAEGQTREKMHQRQEVFAVAAANVVCGMAGGLPATAALARTALNIRSGATSRLAGIINAISSTLIALLLLPVFGYLPLCVVAALLFQVAVGMIESKHLIHAFSVDRAAFHLTLLVAFFCLLIDPTAGIVLGAIIGLLWFAQSMARGYSEVSFTHDMRESKKLDVRHFDSDSVHDPLLQHRTGLVTLWEKATGLCRGAEEVPDASSNGSHLLFQRSESSLDDQGNEESNSDEELEISGSTLVYRVVGDLTYISALSHQQRWTRLLAHRANAPRLVMSLRFCVHVDLDGLDAISTLRNEMTRQGRVFLISDLSEHSHIYPFFAKSHWFQEMKEQGHVFDTLQQLAQAIKSQDAADARRISFDSSAGSI